jgi:hypothetical protein
MAINNILSPLQIEDKNFDHSVTYLEVIGVFMGLVHLEREFPNSLLTLGRY